jgi:hypothetical protein
VDYREILIKVLEDLDAAEVPEDLREVAFTIGINTLLGATPQAPAPQQPAGSSSRPDEVTFPAQGTAPTADSPGAQLSARLGVPYEDVIEVFNFGDKGPELVIGSGRLPSQVAAATKEIAVLIAAARQGIGLEEWTAFGDIRDVCATYGRLDSANFASTMKELESYFGFRSPSPRKREVKLNRPGWERASELVMRLVGR